MYFGWQWQQHTCLLKTYFKTEVYLIIDYWLLQKNSGFLKSGWFSTLLPPLAINDKDKPLDFISFLSEPVKQVPYSAEGGKACLLQHSDLGEMSLTIIMWEMKRKSRLKRQRQKANNLLQNQRSCMHVVRSTEYSFIFSVRIEMRTSWLKHSYAVLKTCFFIDHTQNNKKKHEDFYFIGNRTHHWIKNL